MDKWMMELQRKLENEQRTYINLIYGLELLPLAREAIRRYYASRILGLLEQYDSCWDYVDEELNRHMRRTEMNYQRDIEQAIELSKKGDFKSAWFIMKRYYNGKRDDQYLVYIAIEDYKNALLILNQDWAWSAEMVGGLGESLVAELSSNLWWSTSS